MHLELTNEGRTVRVRRNDQHPEYYLWIDVDDATYFLGVFEQGMTRGEVRRMAERWLVAHNQRKYARKK